MDRARIFRLTNGLSPSSLAIEGGDVVLLTLTGPSGVGKTTIARELISYSPNFRMVVSHTTRPPRESDIEGEYSYISMDAFEERLSQKAFLWRAEHGGNSYGTLARSVIQEVHQENQHAVGIMILIPEVIPLLRDFLKLLGRLDEHIPVFIEPPGERELLARMQKRGDRYADALGRLVESADWTRMAFESTLPYHFLSNNGSVEETVQAILSIVETETL